MARNKVQFQKGLSEAQFAVLYGTEDQCREAVMRCRWPSGFVCPVCALQRLTSHGVAFRSFTEEHLSTENELVRNILLATLSSLAKLEREKISQRTKAGLERARANGKRLGRPAFSDRDKQKLRTALDTGESWHAVSKKIRIPYSTVKKHARALGYKPEPRVSKPKGARGQTVYT